MRAGLVLGILLLLPVPLAVAGEPAPGDVIVLLQPGAALADAPAGSTPLSIIPGVVVPAADALTQAWLAERTGVVAVERAAPLEATSDVNLQLTRADPPPSDAAGQPFTGRGVTVAVVDSGIDATHPDLAGRVKANVKLTNGQFMDSVGDTNGHGTHVAGIVAASGASSGGKVRGVAPEASLVGVDISEHFTTASALLAYDWLYVHKDEFGIRVVVNAWGRVGEGKTFDAGDAEIRAIDRLVDAGVVVLFSASNHGPAMGSLSLEAMDPRVITVGAVDATAQPSSFSSRGPVAPPAGEAAWVKPDVVAPGDTILGLKSQEAAPEPNADKDAFHRWYSGTSQAVPHVAGIVALMLQANASLTPVAAQNALRESAIDIGAAGPDDITGFGLVDAVDAVHRALQEPADRGNVLVAGGDDRYQDAAQLAAGDAPSGLLGFVSAPTAGWSTTFPVKPDASLVTFDVTWAAPAGVVTVTLEKDGKARGSWTESPQGASSTTVRGRLDAPELGMWTLRATGAAPTPVEVTSVVDINLKANPARAADLDARYRLPDSPASAASAFAHGETATALARSDLFLHAHPTLVPTLLAGFVLGVALLWRPQRKRVMREIVLQDIDP